jgi:hypothetical protein
MKTGIHLKHIPIPLPIRKSIPFVIALLVLTFIVWSVFLVWTYPDDGIRDLTPTGYISSIDSNGPAYGVLHEGDILVNVDGVPFAEAYPLFKNKKVGDQIELFIQSDNQVKIVELTLAAPPLSERMKRVMPLVVALIFWVIGVGVQTFSPARDETILLFILFLAIAALMAAGQISNVGPIWISLSVPLRYICIYISLSLLRSRGSPFIYYCFTVLG